MFPSGYIWVALGGALGATARYAVGLHLPVPQDVLLPWSTLCVNWGGSFILGLFSGFPSPHWLKSVDSYRLFITMGFCGGFTTFSTFTAELGLMLFSGRMPNALLYLFLSVIGSLVMFIAGFVLSRFVK